MKKQLLLAAIGLFLLPLAVLREGGLQASVGNTAQGSYLPNLSYDFSDLEVRDNQNNIVQASAPKSSLTALFIGNLLDLTVKIDSHGMRDLWEGINYFSRLFKDTFFNCVIAIFVTIQEALEPKTVRIVHNVYNLWTTLFVGAFLMFMAGQFTRSRSPHLSVVLRL